MIEDETQKEKIEQELKIPIEQIIAHIDPKHNFNSRFQVITPRKTRLSTAPDSKNSPPINSVEQVNRIKTNNGNQQSFFSSEFSPDVVHGHTHTDNTQNNVRMDNFGIFGSFEQFEIENQMLNHQVIIVSPFDFVDVNHITTDVIENNNADGAMENELQNNHNELFSFNGTPIKNQG